jgi:Mrp family chromosome partitioning ATPase
MDTSSKVETLMAVLHEDKSLRQSVEALRDRLVTYFEVNNMTHKPKLVALTACHRAAGVTTVAAGLASVLSETGDGKVLLVDMNETGGAACHFYRGKPELRLVDALENGKRSNAQVQENLYVVAEHDFDGGLPRVLPQRFQHLVPRLRVSDYDYIIFDLPHMSHTSIALRVARFMDVTLLVTEADRTPRQVLRQSARILVESGAQVATVLNRTHPCIPAGLRQELS